MSGIKEVMVSMTRAEQQRLLNNARRAEESEHQAQQRERATQNALDAATSKLGVLNRALNSEIAGLHEDVSRMASEQNRRFRDQAAAHNRMIQQQADEYRRQHQEQAASFNRSLDDVNRRMEQQRRSLQSSIASARQEAERNKIELEHAINDISVRIAARDNNQRRIANEWISQTQAYFNDIARFRHDMFTPGRLAGLRAELEQMLSDMRNDMFQAATSTARGIFNRAVYLKEEVVCAENEWAKNHGLFMLALAETEVNLNHYQNMEFTIAMEHGEEKVEARINYWTNNALDITAASLAEIKQRMSNIDEVSTDELIELTGSLYQLNVQMETAANQAHAALIASQQRAEMANILAGVLTTRCGYDFRQETDGLEYEGKEYDKPVYVVMSDGIGNEISIRISPGESKMDNQLEINYFNPMNDESQRDTWTSAIHESLRGEGIDIQEPVCQRGYETRASDNNAARDIRTIASRTTSSSS